MSGRNIQITYSIYKKAGIVNLCFVQAAHNSAYYHSALQN